MARISREKGIMTERDIDRECKKNQQQQQRQCMQKNVHKWMESVTGNKQIKIRQNWEVLCQRICFILFIFFSL